jgi:hypothetical protein
MEWVAVPHEDSAQMAVLLHVGVIGEVDPHHVVDFAFVPIVRGREIYVDGCLEIVFDDRLLQALMVCELVVL